MIPVKGQLLALLDGGEQTVETSLHVQDVARRVVALAQQDGRKVALVAKCVHDSQIEVAAEDCRPPAPPVAEKAVVDLLLVLPQPVRAMPGNLIDGGRV